MRYILAVLTMLILSEFDAVAAKRAIVIGVDNYEQPGLRLFGKTVNDAESVTKALSDVDGFYVQTEIDKNLDQLSAALDNFYNTIEQGDQVVFYFSGHGSEFEGDNWLLTVDAVPLAGNMGTEQKRLAITSHAVSLRRVIQQLQARGAETAVLIIDACRNGIEPPAKGNPTGGLSQLVTNPPTGVFILYAAAAGQTALACLSPGPDCSGDPSPNSVFTRELLPFLETPGLTIVEIGELVKAAVEKAADSVGHPQRPSSVNELSSMVPIPMFRVGTSPIAPVEIPPVPQVPSADLIALAALANTDILYFERSSDMGLVRASLDQAQLDSRIASADYDWPSNVISCTSDVDFQGVKELAKVLVNNGVVLRAIAPQIHDVVNRVTIENYAEY
ncbi:MAG: caspase family protein [Mesorhizobium sp.]|nr:MAG: caspase family protein [Mesorhizobium sp.]